MCLAIYKPARAVIPVHHLENGYEGNPMGCGFCWPDGGKVKIVKGMYSFKEFLALYKDIEARGTPMLIHFRMATHGGKNEFNCHPFSMANEKFALIHNGVIPIATSKDSSGREMSDTHTFAALVMEPMLHAGINPKKPAFRFLVEQTVGNGNKICVMNAEGEVMIYNMSQGDFEDAVDKDGHELKINGNVVKIWYSNCCYKYSHRTSRWSDDGDDYWNTRAPNVGCGVGSGIPIGFHAHPKLDKAPINVQLPNKNADGTKSARESAAVVMASIAARESTPINLINDKPKEDATSEQDEPEKGPIFDAKSELEITYLIQHMHMARPQAIESLGLQVANSIAYID